MVVLPEPFGPEVAEDLAAPHLEVEVFQPARGPEGPGAAIELREPAGADRQVRIGYVRQADRPIKTLPVCNAIRGLLHGSP